MFILGNIFYITEIFYYYYYHDIFSFVRSVSMDSWNERQIQMMRAGGNEKCIGFLAQYNVPKNMAIAMKYNTTGILNYIII